ncbi:MAG TPA: aromatic ring-hydroxylating dioxygenase subunit alpha [Stellaceae bacterium]|nr:aromatic ring-hydroxylating dioxygenase subunit alpha [Stellaceae bacterium]
MEKPMSGSFLRNCWYVAAEAGEVTRTPLSRLLLGEPVVLYRRADGTPVALEDRCCHRRAPLSKGKVIGDRLQCGYHGFTFDASGACVAIPGQDRVPPNLGVRGYPMVERYNYLWIWMGDAAKADAARIPDFSRAADPAWTTVHDRLPIAAHYQLMVENLIDLSHLAFVHAKTIGTDDTRTVLRFDRGDDFVRVVREPIEVDTAPHNRKQGMGPRCRLEKTIDFAPPSQVVIDIRTTEVAPQKNDPVSLGITVLNACTPETESSTHYFWTSARDYQRDDKQLDAFLYKVTVEAFNEDRDMLEAQQRCIALDPGAPTVSVNADGGSVQMRRLMAELVEREQGRAAAAAH